MAELTSKHLEQGDQYIAPGTPVCIDWVDEGGKPSPEYGVMVHCWYDPEMQVFDCYFASFGDELPRDRPNGRPAILRYTAASFRILAE